MINRPVNFVGFARADKTRDQNVFSDVYRRDKNDDDEKNLPAYTHRRVAFISDNIADQNVIDQALQTRDGIRQHRRRGDFPDGATKRTFDNRAVVFMRFFLR